MATPFLDILTAEEQSFVARKSRGENRPSYFSAAIATTQPGDANAGNIKISIDLEAALILMPPNTKQGLLDFVQTAWEVVNNLNQDDFSLFLEMVSVRDKNYGQVNQDSGQIVEQYDRARSQAITFIENKARQNRGASGSAAEVTSVVIPDLGSLFASLSDSYNSIAGPDELAVHSRITDAGYVYTVQDAATNRARELSSWAAVIQTYLVT